MDLPVEQSPPARRLLIYSCLAGVAFLAIWNQACRIQFEEIPFGFLLKVAMGGVLLSWSLLFLYAQIRSLKSRPYVLVIVLGGVLTPMLFKILNAACDGSEPTVYVLPIESKSITQGMPHSIRNNHILFSVIVRSWSKPGEFQDVDVWPWEYKGISIHDSIYIERRKGLWGVPWFRYYLNTEGKVRFAGVRSVGVSEMLRSIRELQPTVGHIDLPKTLGPRIGRALYYFQFSMALTGAPVCLDIANDGADNQLKVATCGNFSGQFWQMEPTGFKLDYFHLKTKFTGAGKCLEAVKDGVVMNPCGDYSGQYQDWGIEHLPFSKTSVRVAHPFAGAKKCLGIVKSGDSNRFNLGDCDDSSGRVWQLISQPFR